MVQFLDPESGRFLVSVNVTTIISSTIKLTNPPALFFDFLKFFRVIINFRIWEFDIVQRHEALGYCVIKNDNRLLRGVKKYCALDSE